MNATLINFQPMLCRCLFGKDDETTRALVVPRQGNLLNPSQATEIDAWFAYYCPTMTRVLANRQFGLQHVATMLAELELQCVGRNAEAMMQSTLFWEDRVDIVNIMAEYGVQLKHSARQILSYPYFQDGLNTALAYQTNLTLICHIVLEEDPASLKQFKELILKGKLYVK